MKPHPMILPDRTNPTLSAACECRLVAAQLRAGGRDDLARVMERNAAEIMAPLRKPI